MSGKYEKDAARLAAMLKEARLFASARGWFLSATALAINPDASDDESAVRVLNSTATHQPHDKPALVMDIARAFYAGVVLPTQRFQDAVDKDIEADQRARFGKTQGGVQ